MRTFAKEAAFITDPDTLIVRSREVLERNADCSWVDIALFDGAGRFGDVDENDPAIVTLRTSHQTVNLHSTDSVLRGEFAFPMSARGRLVGVLVIGPKRLGESYAPDEREATSKCETPSHASAKRFRRRTEKNSRAFRSWRSQHANGGREKLEQLAGASTDELRQHVTFALWFGTVHRG